jgi:type IV secretion system protein VirD4
MRMRHADSLGGCGGACLALILYLCAAPAFAQVPRDTIHRIVALNVQIAEARYLRDSNQIDEPTWHLRQDPLATERNTLLQQLQQFSADEQKQVDSQIQLLTKVRIAAVERQWRAQATAKNPVTPPSVPKTKAAQDGTSQADYKRDVEKAADLQFREGQVAKRYSQKEIDRTTYQKSIIVLRLGLAALKDKWQLAGRGSEFQRDSMQRLSALNRAAESPRAAQSQRRDDPVRRGRAKIIDILAYSVTAGIVGIFLLWLIFRKGPQASRPVSDIYGTAHYAPTQLDVVDDTCLARGVFFGKSSAPQLARLPLETPGAPVCSTPEHHTLIVARTRTGKGTRVIVPTLLCYGGSAFVIDPKGENAAVTARVRRDQLRQNIHILNPWNELGETFPSRNLPPATYNPLDILERSDRNAVAVAQTLAGAICPAPSNAKDRFWQGSAANILTAVFLWLADQSEVTGERKTLGRAREIVSLSRKDFTKKYLTLMAASEAFDGAIREMAAPFIDLADETYSGIMSNLAESTKFLSDPQVKAATATSSFSMEDLVSRETTVYVVIPTDRMDTQKTWLRLVVAAAMHSFKRHRKQRKSQHRCLFLIDEFAALGRVDDMPRDIATLGGFGVDFALVVQGLDQLKDHYGEARGTILSNCAYKWFCNLNDLDSAKYLSDTLGKKTVVTTSSSDSTSSSNRSSSSSQSTTHGETGRSLLNPDEILNLGRDVAMLIQPNGHPHYLRPVDYWDLPKAFGYLRKEHASLYWEPPLIYDENPYVPPPGSDGHGAGSKEKARSKPSPRQAKMTVDDARDILGVKAGATLDEIRTAYLNLMSKVHPDHGGSNYFAKELNAAREILLGL